MGKPIEQPQNTFVIRFWREWQGGGSDRTAGWRGRIEHIQSGEGIAFYEPQEILAFIGRFLHRLPPPHLEENHQQSKDQ